MRKRLLAAALALCLCLPFAARARESDWIADGSLRLTGQGK